MRSRVALLSLLAIFAVTETSAQSVTNVQSIVKSGRVEITYDLLGDPAREYRIQIVAKGKNGEHVIPTVLAGDVSDVPPGVGRMIWWEPCLEGRQKEEWTIQLTASRELGIRWVFVKGGTFVVGLNGIGSDEKPAHRVTLRDYYIAETEVTFDQYDAFCEETGRAKPSDQGWGRGSRPVINVSWNDAEAYCAWASRQTGRALRLPTEAEWEFAARGGTLSREYTYSGSNTIGDMAWYSGNSGGMTQPVRTKQANERGLHDMSGNVREWCSDWYDAIYYSIGGDMVDPKGPAAGTYRVVRGGSWCDVDNNCRAAYRGRNTPMFFNYYIGFRCAVDP